MLAEVFVMIAALTGAILFGYLIGWKHHDRECKREAEDYSATQPPNCS